MPDRSAAAASVAVVGRVRIEPGVPPEGFAVAEPLGRAAAEQSPRTGRSSSRMPSAMPSPARYHSTIVNSGLCSGPCSPRRNARVTW